MNLTKKEISDIMEKTYNDWMFYKEAKWKLKFVWWPVKCDKSNKWLWLTQEYQGTQRLVTWHDLGRGDTLLTEKRWLCKSEFIFGKIKGTI
jgi:hypothetical protein